MKQLLACVCLIVFLMMGFTSLQGMVLCFETDGRVSLEKSLGGLCNDAFKEELRVQQASASDEALLQAPHCQRCVDVPMSIETVEHEPQKLQVSSFPVDTSLTSEASRVNVGYLTTATQQQLPHPPPLKPLRHSFLSTIILLI